MLWNGWPMPSDAHPKYPWWRRKEGATNTVCYARIDGLWRIQASWFWDNVKVEQFSDEDVEKIDVLTFDPTNISFPHPGRPCWQPVVSRPLHSGIIQGATVEDARASENLAIEQWMEEIDRKIAPRPRPKLRCGQVWRWPAGDEAEILRTGYFGADLVGSVIQGNSIAGYREADFADAVLVSDRAGEAPWEPVPRKEGG